jgi:hypothetical protein
MEKQNQKMCEICAKPMAGTRPYCSLDCKREYNSRRWQQPLSDDVYGQLLAWANQLPEELQTLLKDRMTVQKFAVDFKLGRR